MIDFLHSISKYLPEIETPKTPLTLKQRFYWIIVVLFIYFSMYHVGAIGLKFTSGALDFVQIITASRIGSLLTLGIGPIVIASIFLQLFAGAGLINLNPHDPKQRKKFNEIQVVLAIIIAFFQAYLFAAGNVGINGDGPLVSDAFVGNPYVFHLVAFQIALGAIIVIYLDQIIVKYGIGSGISLFIAAGVSYSVISRVVALFFSQGGIIDTFANGGAEALQQVILELLPLASTTIVFWAVVYGEALRVKLPLSFGFARRSTRPLEFPLFYLSNIPVIFGAAFLLSMMFIARGLLVAEGEYGEILRMIGGILYMATPIFRSRNMLSYVNFIMEGTTPVLGLPEWLHAITYVISLSTVSVIFGKFWAEMAGMDAKSIAEQLYDAGASIPGFRMDKRLIEKKISEYVNSLIVAGSLAVGLLAGLADLTGALGTGTGILLTVGIFYRMYMQIREGLEIYYPSLLKIIMGE